ncbi:MAG: SpoIIE family protein phosphatase, partial [Pseudanabaenaceae cyanobacterium]
SQVSEFLQNLKIGKSGQTFIMEPDGMLVATSLGEPLFEEKQGKLLRQHAQTSKDPITRAVAQRLLQFQDIPSRLQLQNQTYMIKVTPIKDDWGLDLTLAIVVPEADFLAEINASTRNTLVLCLFLSGVAGCLGIWTSYFISRPLTQLTSAAESIAKGNFDQQMPAMGFIELERLRHAFNSMTVQLKSLFETLEEKVQDRTIQLAHANAEISQLNQQLQHDNLRLSQELDIARQIQAMILPKSVELDAITELDIAAYMQPAERMGGDYFDVIKIDDIITIAIGDVTGHGLESGLLMLMLQTAVLVLHEALIHNPHRFLGILNRSIFRNIQRIRSDKSITFSLLAYKQGTLSLSGQHEELLVIRQQKTIERFDTIDLGFPLGLVPQIDEFIQSLTIDLAPGDAIVVFTDGITEAENDHGEMFGIERAHKMCNRVIAELLQFTNQQTIFDDMTLLIAKRK